MLTFFVVHAAAKLACQNLKCRTIVLKDGTIDGNWSIGYKEPLYDN
jgi:hypothetical protein